MIASDEATPARAVIVNRKFDVKFFDHLVEDGNRVVTRRTNHRWNSDIAGILKGLVGTNPSAASMLLASADGVLHAILSISGSVPVGNKFVNGPKA